MAIDFNDKTSNANNLTNHNSVFDATYLNHPSLISYYKLESTADAKGSNTLTNNGTTPFNAAKFSNGADLGATNTTKWLSRTDGLGIAGNSNMSFSMWVKLKTEITSGTYRFFEHGSTTGADRYFELDYQYNSGTLRLFLTASNGTNITFNITLGTSLFYHIAATRNVSGNEIKLYINGSLVGIGTIGTGTAGSSQFGIGANQPGSFGLSSAIFDDEAIFNSVLSAQDILNIYNSGVELGSTALAPFDAISHVAGFTAASSMSLSANDSASLSITGNMTIELWVNLDSLPSSTNRMAFVAKYVGTGNQRSFQARFFNNSGTYQLEFVNSAAGSGDVVTVAVNWTPSIGTWYHLAFVYTAAAGSCKFYVNGVQQGTTQTGLNTSLFDSTAPLELGITDGNAPLDGKLADIRVWNTARTAAQIANFAGSQLQGSETGLVAYYPLQSSLKTWTVTDKTSNANDLTAVNVPTEVISSLPFAGNNTIASRLIATSSQYFEAPDSASLSIIGNITFEAWVYFNTLPSVRGETAYVVNKDQTGQKSYSFGITTSNKLIVQFWETTSANHTRFDSTSAVIISTGVWYHIAIVVTAATPIAVGYVNGSSVAMTSIEAGAASIKDSTATVRFGGNGSTTPDEYMDGYVDEIRIWNTARSAGQIAASYNTELTGSESGLVAYYSFNSLITSNIKTLNGLARASLKNVDGLALASIKTINGLA